MGKISLEWSLKSKQFLGSIVVLLLITSTAFYVIGEKENASRIYTQQQLDETVAGKKAVENDLNETLKVKEIVEQELVAVEERAAGLENELTRKNQQIKFTLDRLEREITARRQVEARLVIEIKQNAMIMAKVKARESPNTSKAVKLEKIVIKPAVTFVGKVIMVNKEYDFMVINLGNRNNLKSGDVLSVYRDQKFMGRVQVERVEEKICAATILSEWKNVEFREDDIIRKM